MIKRVCLAAALALAAAGAAEAADRQGRFKIEGAGALRCERYGQIRAQQGEDYKVVLSWMNGYLTAVNELTPDTFDVLTWQSAELVGTLIDGFCQQNKEVNVVTALGQLVKALMPQRVETLPQIVAAESGGRKIGIYKNVLREVQDRLIRTGHYKGKPDGAYGPGTKAALEAFQRANRIEVTGLPDQRTLVQLFYVLPEQARQGAPGGQRGSAAPQGRQGPAAPPASPEPRMDLRLQPSPQ
jgi:hypothetical protein